VLLGAVFMIMACAGWPRTTSSESLELYRAHAGEPSRSPNRAGCSIRTIRPINTYVVKEKKRDPSIPDEPPESP
jgi:hypothetical protein